MDEQEMRDQLAALAAGMDQFRSLGEEIAAVMAAYMNALLAQGLERAEALTLTVNYQQVVVTSILAMAAEANGEQ
jgi:hypothetical protein